ncbi:DUF1015 domain-containing protein [Paludicola sp. MB14-C6]|uniref:DUF1015 domain-containing protein n=1 Tax=Paludihabitans sp. MB14-C6 TaxID=3070656 RepID=UPI0027DDC236|nr:DUF1015 domain-containing protein [Paludicola sp. MB14-C6]WMJ22534.1 DUF1015 domain-containing protein [Paludicola sp. MB14-C6]
MKNNVLFPATILLPKTNNMTAWSVVACDQYTSEPSYWNQVKQYVKDAPSTYHTVFPEVYLKTADFDGMINGINLSMQRYLDDGLFQEYANTYFYIERTQKNGKIRKGIIGAVDLECYDYAKGSQSAIRATEGTVLERIPPRVKIRENAPLELPHVMLLIDDEKKEIIESLGKHTEQFKKVYDFPLMQNSGSIKGYELPQTFIEKINTAIHLLGDQNHFNQRYHVSDKDVLLFAVGDGNHSLATARQCYLNLKEKIGEEKARNHPARYALVEIVNLHDESLEFEAIHRVIFDVNPKEVMDAFTKRYILSETPTTNSQQIEVVVNDTIKTVYITNPTLNLAVGSLQEFIDEYLAAHSGEVDYIHGEDVVKSLCAENKSSIGFILPSMDKNDLFKTVILDGALPRKTFSMGEACDKRFYLEARKISE